MDLATHHLAAGMQASDAAHAERFNEYRRIAEERRAFEPTSVATRLNWVQRVEETITFHRWHHGAQAVAH
jgi:hypothetical protein